MTQCLFNNLRCISETAIYQDERVNNLYIETKYCNSFQKVSINKIFIESKHSRTLCLNGNFRDNSIYPTAQGIQQQIVIIVIIKLILLRK